MSPAFPDGIRLVLTCSACPEQYDVFDGDRLIGYLRLRHSEFTARWPDAGGEVVYDVFYSPRDHDDWGHFLDEDRDAYLATAVGWLIDVDRQGSAT